VGVSRVVHSRATKHAKMSKEVDERLQLAMRRGSDWRARPQVGCCELVGNE
jgi:hypothetical protein